MAPIVCVIVSLKQHLAAKHTFY